MKIERCFTCGYDDIELKSNEHLLDGWKEYKLRCPACGTTTGPDMNKKRLIKNWNKLSDLVWRSDGNIKMFRDNFK